MTTTEKLLPCPFCGGPANGIVLFKMGAVLCDDCGYAIDRNKASEAIAAWNRRASQATPKGCGYPCGYDCNGACFTVAMTPSDELAQIDAILMEGQGDDDGPQILPDFEPGWSVAAKVEACLHLLEKRRDVIAALAPSDGLREAAATILAVLKDPDSLPYEHHPNWQAIYNAMTEDHNQSMEICGIHDWPSLLTSAMEVMAEPRLALSASPAQEVKP